MKRNANILLLSALLVVVSCTMEEQYADNEQNKISEEQITLQASREGDPETKTVRDESNGDVLWAPGDAISLFYGSGSNGGSKFTSNATQNEKVTNFTGTITAITGGGEITPEATYFWGVYPYNDDVSCDGTTVTMTLPTEQVAVPGTFAPNTFPSIGRSQGLIMGFYNICGGWRFSVTKEGVRRVTLKSNGGEKITGKVKVGLNDSGIPVIKEIIDGSDEVVIECPRGEYFEVGKNYYMIMLPTVFTSGFTMTFETYTEEGVYNRTAKTTISRSKFSGIANLDNYLTTPYTQKTGNIPIEDANFKAYLVENFDGNGDGEISYEEANAIPEINTTTVEIESVSGIEYMTNLTKLVIVGDRYSGSGIYGKINTIDISNNRVLKCLSCSNNHIQAIDISKNVELEVLYCSDNEIFAIDVSKNTALTNLDYSRNQLTTLDVSKNTALRRLICSSNKLTSLDVSKNTVLTVLSCVGNQLTNLDVSNNTALTSLSCENNQLTNLDVSKNTALTSLYCGSNQLTSLDVTKNIALTSLSCYNNQLTSLDVTNNTALTNLKCNSNKLTNLDVSKNTALTSLYCYSNKLTNLDVSMNTSLSWLFCYSNSISTLDLSNNVMLKYLQCYSNNLTSLNVSNNPEIINLFCYSNQLTSLDVSSITNLSDLRCQSNKLRSLDVSQNLALKKLRCFDNQITNIDVSNNSELTDLLCYGNLMTSIDVSKNNSLNHLFCSPMNDSAGNNLLTTLYIHQDQEIVGIIPNRSEQYIPVETQIVIKSESGGSEGTGDEELNP